MKDIEIRMDNDIYYLNKLAERVSEKMRYMCGCENCINVVTSIIKGTNPNSFGSSCEGCEVKESCCTYVRNSK